MEHRRRERGFCLLLGLLLLLVASGAGARPDGPHGGPGKGRRGPDEARFVAQHAERLGLDAATLAEIEKISADSRVESERLRDALHAERERMHELLSQDAPDEAAVMAQAEAISDVELARDQNRLRAMLRIRALLTAEQRAELLAIHRERREARFAPVREACAAEVERFCPDAPEGRARIHCLRENREALGEACTAALPSRHRGRGGFRPQE